MVPHGAEKDPLRIAEMELNANKVGDAGWEWEKHCGVWEAQ